MTDQTLKNNVDQDLYIKILQLSRIFLTFWMFVFFSAVKLIVPRVEELLQS